MSRRYAAEVQTNAGVLDHLRHLERVHGTVVLLCWERPPRPCHRMVLLDILDQHSSQRLPMELQREK